jgi:hypothetical protein
MNQRVAILLFFAGLLAAAVLCTCGCGYARHSANYHAAEPLDTPPPAPVWPRNYTQDLPSLRAVVRHTVDLPDVASEDAAALARLTASFSIVHVGEPLGDGWVTYSLLSPITTGTDDSHQELGADEGLGLGSSSAAIAYASWRERPSVLDSILAKPADRPADEIISDIDLLSATAPFRMRFFLVRPRMPSRGVVLYQWGLSGQRFEQQLVQALADDGWTVLAHGGLSWRRPGALMVSPESGSAATRLSATTVPAEMPRTPGQGSPSAEQQKAWIETASRLAAADFDDALGQYALATRAAYEYLCRNHPHLVGERLVLVGSSFGAIMSPTLVALMGPRFDAAVLIGGGANFLEIAGNDWMDYYYSRVRGYSVRSLRVPARLRSLYSGRYLAHSTLDPFHTAVHLREIPTLMLHASWDQIVPWRTGDVLWERAGRPERWVGSFGHIWMFLTLSRKAEEIASWIDRVCPRDPDLSGDWKDPVGDLTRYDLSP